MTRQEEIREGIATRLYLDAIEVMLDQKVPLEPVDWDELVDMQKEFYRNQASILMSYLHSQGVVLKVEIPLPDNEVWHKKEREFEAYCAGINDMLKWHNDSLEPLIE